ncbi:MAG: serine/threonine-protein phosphatase [Planctomycetota bacterium]|nr:MAG: serine/threonine-protein phosphatase [Planctomycetota bacterium]
MVMSTPAEHPGTLAFDMGGDPLANADPRMRFTFDFVREISRQTDAQRLLHLFRDRFGQFTPRDRTVSLSRRELSSPWYRITRCTDWKEDINPWTQKDRLPLLSSGLLGELLYAGVPVVNDDWRPDPADPAYEYLEGMRSIVAIPLFDGGESINMVVMMARSPGRFDVSRLPDLMMTSNLVGRATQTLILAAEVRKAHEALDAEVRRIGELQRALLPATLPAIPGVGVATYYAAAARAGGDYFDFFDLGGDRWGLLIGDVSGHGPSAAVVMAITRTLLHAFCRDEHHPSAILGYLNERLLEQADRYPNTFVTLFYGEFDARARTIRYASAGHNPPILMRGGRSLIELNAAQSLPLGLFPDAKYADAADRLDPGDNLLLYTDGITEAMNPQGEMYGRERLLECLRQPEFSAQAVIDCITMRLEGFTEGRPPSDDRTMVALRIRE